MADDIQVIDEEGDVIFIIGASKKKLKVSSVMLSRVSPVFKALLGPHFREGQSERSSAQPVEINLPDDDPTAMTRLLELVHLRDVEYLIKGAAATHSNRLLDFAIVTDKYDLVKTLRLQSYGMLSAWLLKVPQENGIKSQGNIVAASYMLDQAGVFRVITRTFMQTMHPAASALLKETSGQRLPMSVLLALQERRAASVPKGLCLRCVQANAHIYDVCNNAEHNSIGAS